eukprot:9028147-Pyramimonas_sp.AAC.1
MARPLWIRRWASRLERPCLALGAQRSTTHVAARAIVLSEAAGTDHDPQVSVHAIVGVAKCFDRVNWAMLT